MSGRTDGRNGSGKWRALLLSSLRKLPVPLRVERLEVSAAGTRYRLRLACRPPADRHAGRRVHSPRTRAPLPTGEIVLPPASGTGDRPTHRQWLVALARVTGEMLAAESGGLRWWRGYGRPAPTGEPAPAAPVRRSPRRPASPWGGTGSCSAAR